MKLNREGVALNAEERNKRNQNWTTLETEVATVSDAVKEALPIAEEALGLSGNLQAQINTLVVEGDSSVEAKQARVDAKGVEAPTLKARLDAEQQATTQQLAETAKKSEVRLKTVKNELEDMSPAVLSAIEGGSGTTFNLLSIPQAGSVSVEKTTFLKTGKNLFNKDAVIKDHYVSQLNGQVTPLAGGYNTSDYIPVLPNTNYSRKQSNYIAYYTSNKVFISGAALSGLVVTTPVNCHFVRISMSTPLIETEQFEIGDVSNVWEAYTVSLDKAIDLDKESIKKDSISLDKTDFLNAQENLFDKDAVRPGGYYKRNPSGTWETNALYVSSNHMAVKGGQTLKLNLKFNKGDVCFWDKNKVAMNAYGFVAGTWTDTITAPDDSLIQFVTIPLRVEENLNEILIADANNYPPFYIPASKKLITFKQNSIINGDSVITKPKTAGKNGLIFGDSITETAVISNDGASYNENSVWSSWVTHTKKTLQLAQVWNYAKSGASYKNRNLEPRQYVGHQVSTAISNNRPADIIIVSAGTNDGTASLGSYDTAMAKTTLESLDTTNLYESIRWTFWTLRKNYPDAICFASTPIQRATNEPLTDLNNAIIKMANRYNFIVINAANESGIVKDFEVNGAAGRHLVDGLHPNDAGKKLMANLFSRVILNAHNY